MSAPRERRKGEGSEGGRRKGEGSEGGRRDEGGGEESSEYDDDETRADDATYSKETTTL